MDDLTALVGRAQGGDLDAYGELVRRYQSNALAYAFSLTRDFHIAQDVVQDAFVRAYRDLNALRCPRAFQSWFRRVVFKYSDRTTRVRRVPTVPLEHAADISADDVGPADQIDSAELVRRVMDEVHRLPEHQETATRLFYVDGYSQREIAEFMKVPVGTVKKRLHAARRQMRARMMYLNKED